MDSQNLFASTWFSVEVDQISVFDRCNSFRITVGVFRRYPVAPSPRGSHHCGMAKQLKDFDGHIEAIKTPRFAEDRKVWVLMVKENGRWTAVVSKDEQRIKDHYQLIESKRISTLEVLRMEITPVLWLRKSF